MTDGGSNGGPTDFKNLWDVYVCAPNSGGIEKWREKNCNITWVRDRGTVGSAFSVFLSSERTSGNQKKLEEKKILVHWATQGFHMLMDFIIQYFV